MKKEITSFKKVNQNDLMSKRLKKVCTVLNYIEH